MNIKELTDGARWQIDAPKTCTQCFTKFDEGGEFDETSWENFVSIFPVCKRCSKTGNTRFGTETLLPDYSIIGDETRIVNTRFGTEQRRWQRDKD